MICFRPHRHKRETTFQKRSSLPRPAALPAKRISASAFVEAKCSTIHNGSVRPYQMVLYRGANAHRATKRDWLRSIAALENCPKIPRYCRSSTDLLPPPQVQLPTICWFQRACDRIEPDRRRRVVLGGRSWT